MFIVAVGAAPAHASHSWGSYHWAQAAASSPQVTIPLGESLSQTPATNWPALFRGASASTFGSPGTVVNDWSNLQLMPLGTGNGFPDVLDAPRTAGYNATSQKRCRAYDGRIEVCNSRYGFNGWLGLAQIWTSGQHIVKAVAKMNDSYLNGAQYGATAKQHVLCQEVGHGFGLDHQDESGADLNTCMDYSSALDNAHPNSHDNEQINTIYRSHSDTTTQSAQPGPGKGSGLGRGEVRRLRRDLYVEGLGAGQRLFTFVTWVSPGAASAASDDQPPE